MLSGMLGRKVGMTQVFGPNGVAIPVTVIEAGPCVVTQVKTVPHDGYEAVQLGFGTKKRAKRPELGHLGHTLTLTERQRRKQQQEQAKSRREARAKGQTSAGAASTSETATETEAEQAETAAPATPAKQGGRPLPSRRARSHGHSLGPFAVLREVKVIGEAPAIGESVTVEMFSQGETVDVIGTSKGKGFAGVMKRHGFGGGPRTHGQSDRARAPGSIGPGTTPGRVLKGTRMAGRMGNARVTVKGLEIVQADAGRNLLVLQGSIPGPNGGLVIIRKSVEAQAAARTAARQAER